jgi:hypothetical protein
MSSLKPATTVDQVTPPPYSQASATRTDPIESTPLPANGTTNLDKKQNPQPQQPKYKTSVPNHQLGRFAVPTDCPVCRQRNITKLTYKIGGITQ